MACNVDSIVSRAVELVERDLPALSKNLHEHKSTTSEVLCEAIHQLKHGRASSHDSISQALDAIKKLCDAKFLEVHWSTVKRFWRRLYTDALILKACHHVTAATAVVMFQENENGETDPSDPLRGAGGAGSNSVLLTDAIRSLDMVLIVAGAPGQGRKAIVLELIRCCQEALEEPTLSPNSPCLSRKRRKVMLEEADSKEKSLPGSPPVPSDCDPPRAHTRVRELPRDLSMSGFVTQISQGGPFVLRQYSQDWPASKAYQSSNPSRCRWDSGDYLRAVAGRGRVVPVEVGDQYDDPEWGQQILLWSDFLRRCHWDREPEAADESKHEGTERRDLPQKLYLAQHSLFDQFPSLQDDILVPDYVYSAPPAPPHMPTYQPPVRIVESDDDEAEYEEHVVKSVWVGPAGVTSPAHTDPYYNCYVQVVGRKLVWIAPPDADSMGAMYCHGRPTPSPPPLDGDGDGDEERHQKFVAAEDDLHPRADTDGVDITSYMTNTSRVDVFGPAPTVEDTHPRFTDDVEARALWTVLEPGDMLCMPPKWWHAMRTLTKSFSVSFWF
ncbi:unnamed protein product [Parajaminaea phylloscopi]